MELVTPEELRRIKREAAIAAYAAAFATLALRRSRGCVPDFDRIPMNSTAARLSRAGR